VFETGAGETPVSLSDGEATMTQAPFDPGHELAPAAMAPLLGLDAADVAGTPRVCSTAFPQAFVQVADREALRALRPDLSAIGALAEADAVAAWCEHGGALAQRVFLPKIGIAEDPATGSAAGALGALRVFAGGQPGPVTVRQGDELGRPSEIHVTVGGRSGAPEDIRVGGRAVLVMEGVLAPSLAG
jgi:trans-2,3-dihydro-3-hydroxyanthranilate isomerase